MSSKKAPRRERSIREVCDRMLKQSLILKEARHDFERSFIRAVLEKARWNQTRAAKMLGIHRNTLLAKAGRLGVLRPRQEKNTKV